VAGKVNSEQQLYKIGQVIERSGLSRQVIHNYTLLGLIRPVQRTDAGHRLYSEQVFKRLKLVRSLVESGMTLRDIAQTYFRNK